MNKRKYITEEYKKHNDFLIEQVKEKNKEIKCYRKALKDLSKHDGSYMTLNEIAIKALEESE